MPRTALLFAILAGAARLALADAGLSGTTAAPLVALGTGARAIALGQAYAAVPGDSGALSYNPAGIADAVSDIEWSHNAWFGGAYSEHLDGLVDLGPGGSLGANLSLLSYPSQEITQRVADTPDPSQNFSVLGSFSPYDLYATLAYANTLAKSVLYGASLKPTVQNIDGQWGLGLGFDVGAMVRTPVEGLVLGVSVQNIGGGLSPSLDAAALPEIVRWGASYKAFSRRLLVSADFDAPNDAPNVFALGLEYDFDRLLYPRLGYRVDGLFNPWSAGFGVKKGKVSLDFAYVPYGVLGQTYRISLGYRFDATAFVPVHAPKLQAAAFDQSVFLYWVNTPAATAPGGAYVFEPRAAAPERVRGWALFIYDADMKLVRNFGRARPLDAVVPWDGLSNAGLSAKPGAYWGVLGVAFDNGKTVYSNRVGLSWREGVSR